MSIGDATAVVHNFGTCPLCYEGTPHACSAQLRQPITREVGEVELRERVARLERQIDSVSRECAHLRANVPDLDDLRKLKEVASVPDWYVPMFSTLHPAWSAEAVTPVKPREAVTLMSPTIHVPILIRGLVCAKPAEQFLEVQAFYIGQQLYSASGGSVMLSDFCKVVREQTTWRVPVALTLTLQLYNRGAVPVSFSGAFIAKAARDGL